MLTDGLSRVIITYGRGPMKDQRFHETKRVFVTFTILGHAAFAVYFRFDGIIITPPVVYAVCFCFATLSMKTGGKSSRIVNPLSDEQGAFILDSDEMKKLIPEYAETNGGAANAVHEESKNLMNKVFAEFTNKDMKGTNIAIPIIGGNVKSIEEYVKPLINAGYDVEIAYKSATAKESANRVIKRAIQTGRFIPTSVVQNYDDNNVRNAYEEILAADYDGKKVKRSKYSEL